MPQQIQWNGKGRPEILLDTLKNIAKKVNGRIVFKDLQYVDIQVAIPSFMKIPNKVGRQVDIYRVVYDAVTNCLEKDDLGKENFLKEVNGIVNNEIKEIPVKYTYLTSISCIDRILPFEKILIEGIEIISYGSDINDVYPKKYASRVEVFKNHDKDDHDHIGYTKVGLSGKFKSEKEAVHRFTDTLDLVRAILTWCTGKQASIINAPYGSLTSIQLGQYHTLHDENGEVIKNYWYEPNFRYRAPFYANEKILKDGFFKFYERLDCCKYKARIKESLLMYIRGLDEHDPNVAAVRIWSALEFLASPNKVKKGSVINKCAALYKDSDYNKQILSHLNEFRNSNIHAGSNVEYSKIFCAQIQNYFCEFVRFHLFFETPFDSLEDANDFLELPSDKEEILSLKKQINQMIKFRNIGHDE